MFDDFRQQAEESEFQEQPLEGEDTELGEQASAAAVHAPLSIRRRAKRILGMTAPQRFVIAVLLMFEVCILGTMFLLAAQRVVPSFLY